MSLGKPHRGYFFQTEIYDEDGGGNITRIVLDASEIGLGIVVLPIVPEVEEDRNCVRSDYIGGDWGACDDDDLSATIRGTETRCRMY